MVEPAAEWFVFVLLRKKGGQLTSRAPIIVRGKSYSASTNVPTGDLELATSEDVDFVSLSFVEDAASVEQLRSELRDRGCNSGVVAKVETPKALQNIESIVEAADAIMIARGDLGTSIAFEKVRFLLSSCSFGAS